MKHSIMIPDDIWEWWQNTSGLKNPARAIRDALTKLTFEYRLQEHVEDSIQKNLLPEVDFDVPDDAPTLITIQHTGVCMYCLRVMRKGDEAFWFTSHGRKHVAHPECWEEDRKKVLHGT